MLKNLKDNKRSVIITTTVLAAIVAVLVIVGILLSNYTEKQIYKESVSQLEELSTQLFEKLDVQIDHQWGYLERFEEACGKTDTMTKEELTEQIMHCEDDLSPVGKTLLFRAIDENGYYYTDEGRQGFWTGLSKLDYDESKQSFLITNWLDNENYMAFVIKNENPLTVDGSKITHFVLLRSMTDMQPYFHSTAFSENNMTYIVDSEGLLLFEDGDLEINFEGKDVFYSLSQQKFLHLTYEEFLEEASGNEWVCTDVEVNGEDYFVVYNALPEYEWGVVLLVDAADVAATTADMVNSMMSIYIIILILLVAALIAAFFMLSRFLNNKKVLEIKEKNEAILEKSNQLLEEANIGLHKAQKRAEELQKKAEEAQKVAEEAQKDAEDALVVANNATKAKSQFLANMSHDIRTPMNAIVGITKLMEGDIDDREKMPYYISKLEHSSNYMLGLINDILDMSKIESGEVKLNLEPLKMAAQAGQIESIIRAQSSEKEQEFTVVVHEITHEYLIGDSIRIRQIFINLLNNAVKYTQHGGAIRFEIREVPCNIEDHATIVTSVIDNGYGMSQEFLTHLFEPFTREESSVTNKVQGTGLGMSITKNLVDLMGGTITVQSELNKGSRFDVTLTLPIDTEKHVPDISSMMLVSNEELLIENVRAAMKEEPVELRIAATADEAVAMLKEKTSEAILLSGYLKNEDLVDMVHLMRETAKDSVLIFCCDYAYRKHIRDVLTESGVDGFISRPFFVENLITAVDNAHAKADDSDDDRRSGLSGKRFLCAEDNELNAEILEALLDMHNATCKIYPDGEELVKAFADVREGDYDAILMDVKMPKMDGMEATREIREGSNPLGRTIPIVAMTANAFSSDVQECLEAGMDAHLAKPVDIAALERTLHEISARNSGGGRTPYNIRQL